MTHSTAKPVPSARRLAYQALYDVLEKDAYSNIVLQRILAEYPLKAEEAHLLTELVYGVLRKYNHLFWIIGKLSTQKVKKLHPSVRILLCLSLYQLLFLTRIPESAAVNESVKIAKKVTHPGNVRFVNGVLRNFLRKKTASGSLREKRMHSSMMRSPITSRAGSSKTGRTPGA